MLGWGITIGAGLASYPIDTVRRRMMMTSGQAVKYKSSIDCFQQVREKGSWGVVPDSLTSQGAITLPSVWFRGTAGRWAWCLGLGWAPVGACRVGTGFNRDKQDEQPGCQVQQLHGLLPAGGCCLSGEWDWWLSDRDVCSDCLECTLTAFSRYGVCRGRKSGDCGCQ